MSRRLSTSIALSTAAWNGASAAGAGASSRGSILSLHRDDSGVEMPLSVPSVTKSGVEMPLSLPSVSKSGVGVERFELIEVFDFKASGLHSFGPSSTNLNSRLLYGVELHV